MAVGREWRGGEGGLAPRPTVPACPVGLPPAPARAGRSRTSPPPPQAALHGAPPGLLHGEELTVVGGEKVGERLEVGERLKVGERL